MQPTHSLNRGGIKLFPTENLAHLWVRRMLRKKHYNYFVGFRDANPATPFGIMFAWAVWPGESTYIRDIFPHVTH